MVFRVSFVCVVTSSILYNAAHAATINVPADQLTIQAGINAAVNGDEIGLAPCAYNEIIDFSLKAEA